MPIRKALPLLLSMMLLAALPACLPIAETAADKDGLHRQDAETDVIDPFRLPEPVEVTMVKSVRPDLKLPPGDTIEDNLFTRYLYDKTNVKFKILWYASGNDYDQKFNLALASDDLPDAMIVDEKTFRMMAKDDLLEDLTEVYDKYASPLLKEIYGATRGEALDNATYNGKLMAIPNILPKADSYPLVWVRKDWLDRLKLPEPRTLEDVAAIAQAFIERDPDRNGIADTIGMTGNSKAITSGGYTEAHDFKAVFNAFGAYPNIWHRDAEGKLVYGSTTPEAKQALAQVRKWYAEGLIDQDFALRKNPFELVNRGQTGVFFAPWWAPWEIGEAVQNDPAADWRPYAIAGNDGKYHATMVPMSGNFHVVKKGFKHPEALIVNLNLQTRFGREPTEDDLQLDVTYIEMFPLMLSVEYRDAVSRKHDALMRSIRGETAPQQLSQEMRSIYERYLRDQANPGANAGDWAPSHAYRYSGAALKRTFHEMKPLFTASTPTMEKKWAKLQKLENETFFKIVLGEEPIEAFDRFVVEWMAQGGAQILNEIEQELRGEYE
ncbi:extracellular solute-binding protein [Paenibacillus sp. MSJ-34]|uniref:extracellular solute-binding protein n=1 Tax=Paenibacillus sp. MSJ-34 TaxID=2841529 RepID=UPI001C0F8FA2|nr:extracellular solute-binding protein [Paenibacillus sp. MSJ-34]MBU5442940.1 extracellular solute-binding protein [Paenibacillus sp. MSJ-34]